VLAEERREGKNKGVGLKCSQPIWLPTTFICCRWKVDHIEPLTTLPLHHKDPFDRVIAATVLVEGPSPMNTTTDVAFRGRL
jgi:PIN domain nuclease of toxin-antitoxin system